MLQFQMLLFFSKYAAVSSSNRIPSDMNSCWNIYSCSILRKFPWILSMWIERTKMESFPTNSRVKTFFSKKHTEQPCSAHCFSLAIQQLLSAYTHFYLHWQYPLQTNLILFSSSHSSLGFFFIHPCWWNREDFPNLSLAIILCTKILIGKRKLTPNPQQFVLGEKAFAARKISRWQLCNQYILWPPVSSITLLVSSQCLINSAL